MAEPKPSEKVSSLMKSKAVAHNPTGVDPTPDQWQKIVAACKERILESKACLPCICFMVALLSHQPDYSFLRFWMVLKLRKAHSIVGQCLPGLCKWPVGKGWLLPEAESWLHMIASQFQTPFDPRTKKCWPKWRFTESGMEFFIATWFDFLICTVSICFTSLEPPLTG